MAVTTVAEGQIYTHSLPQDVSVVLPDELWGFESLSFLHGPNGEKFISRMEPGESRMLFDVCASTPGHCLDIGTRHGASALVMAVANPEANVLSVDISSDIHPAIHECIAAFRLVERIVFADISSRIPVPSVEFGVVCFDGDHSSVGISRDIAAQWNAIRSKDGKAIFHDVEIDRVGPHDYAPGPDANGYQRHITPIVNFLIRHDIAEVFGADGHLIVLRKNKNLSLGLTRALFRLADKIDPRPQTETNNVRNLVRAATPNGSASLQVK